MGRKLLLAAVVLVVLGGAGAFAVYEKRKQPDPIEKRGSASEEFDVSAEPGSRPASRRSMPEDWPTFGYDVQRTKLSPFGHRPPYFRTWKLDAGDTLEFPPSAAYGNIYIAQQKGLFFALDGRTGRRLFTKRGKRCAASSPTVKDGTIYQSWMHYRPCKQDASHPTGLVVALNARTGRKRWSFRAAPIESSPLLRKGILYVGSWDGRVYAIRARNGRRVWAHNTGDRVNTSAAYSKGRIFIANDSGTLYALNARTGRRIWSASQAKEFFYATPVVAYGRVFIGSTDGTMYAYGQRSGRLLWATDLGTYVYSSAAIYERRVYAGSYDGKLYALDAATGDVRWKREMPSAVHASPVVMDGLVYAATCGTCGSAASRRVKTGRDSTYAFDARTGRKVWFNNGGKYASPIVADRHRVYLVGRAFLYGMEPYEPGKAGRAKVRRLRAERHRRYLTRKRRELRRKERKAEARRAKARARERR